MLAGILAARAAWSIPFVSDDAWISFRYAWNLVHGRGLTWNPGLEPVEGYSNLLWTLWSALGIALGQPVGRWAVAWGAAFALGAALGTAACVRAAGGGRTLAWGAAVMMAASPLMGRWMGLGLETPLFTFLMSMGCWRGMAELSASRQGAPIRPWSALAFGLACLCRAEGPLYLAVPLLFALSRGRQLGRYELKTLALAAAPVALQLLARILYYGELVPNTARAKVGGNLAVEAMTGLRYLAAGLSYNPLLSATVGVGVLGVLAFGRHALPLLAPGLVVSAFVVAVGGDQFSDMRFLLPALPAALAAAAVGWTSLARRAGRLAPAVLVVGLGLSLGAAIEDSRITSVNVARAEREQGGPGSADGRPPLPWKQLSPPWAEVGKGPLWWTGAPVQAQPLWSVHWFYAYLMENLRPGEAFFFQEVGLIGYVLVDSTLLDGRGLTWRPAVDLSRSKMPGTSLAEQREARTAFLAAFEEQAPAIVFLQCTEEGFFGPSEEVLLESESFRSNYTFVAWGPYFANRQICAFRREGAGRPSYRETIERYVRMEEDAPDELDWADRRLAIERRRAIPVEQIHGSKAPPFVLSRRAGSW